MLFVQSQYPTVIILKPSHGTPLNQMRDVTVPAQNFCCIIPAPVTQ